MALGLLLRSKVSISLGVAVVGIIPLLLFALIALVAFLLIIEAQLLLGILFSANKGLYSVQLHRVTGLGYRCCGLCIGLGVLLRVRYLVYLLASAELVIVVLVL